MKIIAAVFLFLLVVVLGREIYFFWRSNETKAAQLKSLGNDLQKAETDYQKFQADLNYYSNPVNLEKDLRERFNYKGAGEKSIVIVPNGTSTSQ